MDLTQNLVAYWRMEQNPAHEVIRDSVGGNVLTPVGVAAAEGKVDRAIGFQTSTNSYLEHASNATLQMGNISYSIAFWVYTGSLSGGAKELVTKYKNAAPAVIEYYVRYHATTQRFLFAHGDGGLNEDTVEANDLGIPVDDTWYFIVATRDKVNGRINISVNRDLNDSAPSAGTVGAVTSRALRIGASSDGAGLFQFNGRIDEVGLWKRLLTWEEVSFLYNDGLGRSFAELQPAAECVSIECCETV